MEVANVPAESRFSATKRTSGRKRKLTPKAVAASYLKKMMNKEAEPTSSIATQKATLAKRTSAAVGETSVKEMTAKL